ncbi:MAG: hypothetical protein ABIJ82_02730 [Patescibacteria group bacterium]|nr:hypothetical protein [Patescibacteria group bacterium]MBU1952606.1 hypothetical protein [Patescibacteria group bacterium]
MDMGMLVVFVICLLVVPVYYKTKSFNSKNGILLFILGFSALFLRMLFFRKYPLLATLNKDTLFLSGIILFIPFVLFFAYSLSKNVNILRKRHSYLFKLLLSYILFGALQQLFFLTIFTDSVYYLSSNFNVTFLTSVIFFFTFHLNWDKELRKFLLCLIIFVILNTFIYLWMGNILPQMVAHGVVGSILYTAFSKEDQLKKRLS